MRVLVVTNFYPPHHFGGYELSCRDVVERWRKRGHEVVVLAADTVLPGQADPSERRRDVRRDLQVYLTADGLRPWPLQERFTVERHNQRALRRALAQVQPDVVSVWHMAGVSMSLLNHLVWNRYRTVCVVCDEWPAYVPETDPWNRLWRPLPRPAVRVVRRLSGVPTGVANAGREASFCFVSHDLRDRCLKRSPWEFPRSTVTYSGLDTQAFPICEPLVRTWTWDLVTAGRLDPRKGFETAIRALPLLPPNATLDILSAAPSAHGEELKKLAKSLGVADRLQLSRGDRSFVRRRFSEAGAVIFPSTWNEPFGLVPIEAMACSTPVVATGTGGSAEFLNDGLNCLRFPPGDERALGGALLRLADSDDLRRTLVSGGATTAAALTADRLATFLEAWHLAAANDFRTGVPGPPLDMRAYISRES